MTDLTLWTNPRSRGAIARWMLEEIGQHYKAVPVAFGPDMHGADYLAINPMGKVPSLRHHGQIITETAAICLYLADTFPEAGLAPTAAERGAYLRWVMFGAGPVETAVTSRALGLLAPADKRGLVGYGDFESVIKVLEARVSESPYLAGERFTAADVYTGSQIGWGLQFATMPDLPAFRSYWDRIKDRPARLRAAALDEEMQTAML